MKGVVDDIDIRSVEIKKEKRAWWSLWLYKRKVREGAWLLLEDFDYYGITVKAGFVFDFASIPRAVWNYISPDEIGIRAASLVHDWLYNRRGVIFPDHLSTDEMIAHFGKLGAFKAAGYVQFPRSAADKVFLEIMTLRKLRADKRLLAYQAVDKFGWIFWNKKVEESISSTLEM